MIAADSIHAWSGQELLDREDWRIDAAPALERDLDALLAWAGEHADPLATLKTSSLQLPGFDALAARARDRKSVGEGKSVDPGGRRTIKKKKKK